MNLREWALPVYTIMIQMSVGMLLVLWILRSFESGGRNSALIDQIIRDPLLVIITTVAIGLAGAHFHLSRPFLSFLAVRNFATSWLSREIVFTIVYTLLIACLWGLQWFRIGSFKLKTVIGWLAILFGFVTVYCMGHIYLLPTQAAWNVPTTIPAFFGSVLLLGVMAQATVLIMDLRFTQVRQDESMAEWSLVITRAVKRLAFAALGALPVVILINGLHLYGMFTGPELAHRSYELLVELYQPLLVARFLMLAGVGYLIIPVARMPVTGKTVGELFTPAYLACLLAIVAEVLGRFLFYASHIRIGL